MIESFVWLTMCVYFEARGEGMAGKTAVAQVIMNRAEQRKMTVVDVIKEPYQFSWLNDGIPDKVDDFPAFVECARAVWNAWQSRLMGITLEGANHYFNPAKVQPGWAKKMKLIGVIGRHNFYRS